MEEWTQISDSVF